MTGTIKNRAEILFLYDVTNANPNGDPADENKPRIDEETGNNIVTDVRLKRTIRDYLITAKNKDDEIFVKEIIEADGTQKSREKRIAEEGIKSAVDAQKLLKYLDIRLFGATIGLKKDKGKTGADGEEKGGKGSSITWTGPVQFKFGRSLHKVDPTFVKGTTVMPSKEGLSQGTFTERYILPYSLIAFYGIANENAARCQNIPLTDSDITLMLDGLWNGTKNLISGSKFGHMPRLLMQIVYKEGLNFHIGELDKFISLSSELPDEAIRDIADVTIDVSALVRVLEANRDKIEKIKMISDDRIKFVKGEKVLDIKSAVNGLLVEDIVL
ncbi:MAG: hypothetical protein A4E57_04388 [Syntrophorhabdaceae bacterium PtaU1.Bin034]|nr:MAG: hypothetical protein A4E57_04388 [Syntrophorhabdaceae bacterium PtaU1.Bin034]